MNQKSEIFSCEFHKIFMNSFFIEHFRSSHQRCSIKKLLLKISQSVTGKHLCSSLFLIKLQTFRPSTLLKETPIQVFSFEYCEIFKGIYFEDHVQTSGCFCLLNYFAFWLIYYLFLIDGVILRVLAKNMTLCEIYRSNQPSWKIHGTT